jgi:photosystem II stability/assembly factor-like uncharacterized protein
VHGAQWVWQNPLSQGNYLNQVSCVDANNGMAVGDNGTILRTTDGGNNWIIQSIGITNNGALNGLFGVSFVDTNTGTMVGDKEMILRTTDGGANWERQTSGTSEFLYGVSLPM